VVKASFEPRAAQRSDFQCGPAQPNTEKPCVARLSGFASGVELKLHTHMAALASTMTRSVQSLRDIAVEVKEGVVTLSGFYGVRSVANDIEVKLPSARNDPEIARDAVRELESHIGIPTDKIADKIKVRRGWLTLGGTADWQYQKILAESASPTTER
jgi:hypothetical protein